MTAEMLDPHTVDFKNPFAKMVYLWHAWMEDRTIILENNTPAKVLELLRAEIDEFFQAHRDKKLESDKFDEIPGELADILIFAITWYLKNGEDPTVLLQGIHKDASTVHDQQSKKNPFSTFILEHMYMARIQQAMERIELEQHFPEKLDQKSIQDAQMQLLLEALFLYAGLHHIDLTAETPEKIAFDDVRYTSKHFSLQPGEVYSVDLYKRKRKEAKAETNDREWKTMFYEIPKETTPTSIVTPRLPVAFEKGAKRFLAAKLALGQFAGAFFALF